MQTNREHNSNVSESYYRFLAVIWFLLILLFFMTVSAKADVTMVLSPAAGNNTNNVIDKPGVPEENGQDAAATVQSPAKVIVFMSQSEREKQFAVPEAEKDNPYKNTAPFNDDYMSNETALKAIETSIATFKGRIKKRFSLYLEDRRGIWILRGKC